MTHRGGRPRKDRPQGFASRTDMPDDPKHLVAIEAAGRVQPLDSSSLSRIIAAAGYAANPTMIAQLAAQLRDAAGHYRNNAALQPIAKRVGNISGTNKPKWHLRHLLADCANAWQEATGDDLSRWAAANNSPTNGTKDHPAVTLARDVHEIVTGKPLTQNLRRQVAEVKQHRRRG